MTEPNDRLFVYGSLGPGGPNENVLEKIGGSWEPATVCGILRDEGWGAAIGYPGIELRETAELVAGHLFRSERLVDHWSELDRFEGPAYQREVTTVQLEHGRTTEAFIYALKKPAG